MKLNRRRRRLIAATGESTPPVIPTSPQFMSSNQRITTDRRQGTSGARSDVQMQTRSAHRSGAATWSNLMIGTSAFYSQINANGPETNLGNDYNFESGIETITPSATTLQTWSSAGTKNVINGDALILSDSTPGLTIGPNENFWVRRGHILAAATDYFPASGLQFSGSVMNSPISASQIAATGTFSTPAGGSGSGLAVSYPNLIVGVPDVRTPSVLIIGDSIAAGVGDGTQDFNGNVGFIRRGLASVNGNQIPCHGQDVPGLKMVVEKDYTKVKSAWPYATHAIIETGFNDINDQTLGAMQSALTTIVNDLKSTIGPYGKRIHVSVCTICPSTTSSNSWIDAAGQTTKANWAVGAKRDQYNDWLVTQAGTLFDTLIDIRTVTDDPANPGKWYTNGTANYPTGDSVHPAYRMVARMASVINSWALGIGISRDGTGYAGSPPAYSAKSILGLFGWFNETGINDSLGFCQKWDDISGYNNHAPQLTAARRPAITSQNGIDCLSFDGIDDFLESTGMAALNQSPTITAYIAYVPDTTKLKGWVCKQQPGSSSYFGFVQADDGVSLNRGMAGANANPTNITLAPTNDIRLVNLVKDGTRLTSLVNDTAGSVSTGANNLGSSPFRFGAGDGGTADPFKGKICEALFFIVPPLPAEDAYIRNYLKRWGTGQWT